VLSRICSQPEISMVLRIQLRLDLAGDLEEVRNDPVTAKTHGRQDAGATNRLSSSSP